MKKIFVMMMMAVMAFSLTACKDDDDAVQLVKLTVQVTGASDVEDFDVELVNATTASSYMKTTDAKGTVTFEVTPHLQCICIRDSLY